MAHYTDWFPTTRENQLSMGLAWNSALANNSAAWNIPAGVQQELLPLTSAAESALAQAKDESTRTPVVTTLCREAFKALEDKMRDIKKRYFYVPPLTDADLVSLGAENPRSYLVPKRNAHGASNRRNLPRGPPRTRRPNHLRYRKPARSRQQGLPLLVHGSCPRSNAPGKPR